MDYAPFGDQGLEAILSVQECTKPNLTCPSINRIAFICTNPNCNESLSCGSLNCQSCWSRHDNCGDYVEHLSTITEELNLLVKQKKECIEKVRQINNNFVNFVTETFKDLVGKLSK